MSKPKAMELGAWTLTKEQKESLALELDLSDSEKEELFRQTEAVLQMTPMPKGYKAADLKSLSEVDSAISLLEKTLVRVNEFDYGFMNTNLERMVTSVVKTGFVEENTEQDPETNRYISHTEISEYRTEIFPSLKDDRIHYEQRKLDIGVPDRTQTILDQVARLENFDLEKGLVAYSKVLKKTDLQSSESTYEDLEVEAIIANRRGLRGLNVSCQTYLDIFELLNSVRKSIDYLQWEYTRHNKLGLLLKSLATSWGAICLHDRYNKPINDRRLSFTRHSEFVTYCHIVLSTITKSDVETIVSALTRAEWVKFHKKGVSKRQK